jgi:hypothetical protein
MTAKELLIQEIENLPPELLTEALGLIRAIKLSHEKIDSQTETKNKATSTGNSLLEHLKKIGKWEGGDLEECLQLVYSSRGDAEFDCENPFD